MSEKNEGSCLCGAVQFRVLGGFDGFLLCHCTRCRKDTGSAHAANLFASEAVLEWLAGESLVTTFRLPATRHAKAFCSQCGSALPCAVEGAIMVPAGCLDTVPSTKPQAHIFCASRAGWDRELARLPHHPGLDDS